MKVGTKLKVDVSHKMNLPYESKCNRLHGHTMTVEIEVEGKVMEDGMVIDFADLKAIGKSLDHTHLNDVIEVPTAENLAEWIVSRIEDVVKEKNRKVWMIKVRVWETEDNWAEIEKCYVQYDD